MTDPSTKFAILTPPGTAAVATVGLVGPRAWEIARRLFRPASSSELPTEPAHDRFTYGQYGGPPGDAVVMSSRPAAAGAWVELHCHGGPEVIRMVAAELSQAGAAPANPMDLLTLAGVSAHAATAQLELTRAPTLRTATILLDQSAGAFDQALAQLNAAITACDLSAAMPIVESLAAHAGLGRHLTRAWRIAMVGAPNVGKSSLVNALAGYRRSVVTEIAGTTRDLVVTALAIDGWPVELIDTAGQHPAGDSLEEQAIERARAAAADADLCLWVVDVETAPTWPAGDASRYLFVINKSDLPARWDVGRHPGADMVSAQTGTGLSELCDRISRRLVPAPPSPGAAVPFAAELAEHAVVLRAAVAAGDLSSARAILASLEHPIQSARPG